MAYSTSTSTPKIFKDYHTALRLSLSKEKLDEFKNLEKVEDKIAFVQNLKDCPMFPVKKEINCGKNSEEAKMLKEKGNTSFQKKNYHEACRLYSQSILKTENSADSNSELSIYYANRSAALYHLKEYNFALDDIEFSLKNNYPKELIYKLLDRKARCLLALEKNQKACETFKKTLQALDNAKLATDKKQKWQTDVQIMIMMLNKNKQKDDAKKISNVSKFDTIEIEGKPNSKYEALSSAIEIKYTEELGRHGVAKQDINAGKVILVEDPHCAVLLQKYQKTNCYHCFRRIKILVACPTCVQILFCSHNCANQALSTYHKVECPILRTIWKSEISVTCHISFRIIAQQKLEYFLNKKGDLNKAHFAKQSTYKSSDYETLFNLVSHEENRKPEDLLNRIHIALFLLKCLKYGDYFQGLDPENEDISENEIFITKLLFHHLQVSQFNAHEVSELQVEDNLMKCRSKFIGGAIYPTLALLNHSCNPGVTRYFQGTKVITRAVHDIKAGEMVSENYGPIFTESKKQIRQQTLKDQYWFNCTCEACLNDWPLISEMMDDETIRFRCSNKKCQSTVFIDPNIDGFLIKCRKCSQTNNILKALKYLKETDQHFKEAQILIQQKKVDKALKLVLSILHLLNEMLVPPFKDYYICEQVIRTCFLSKGNVFLE